MSVLSVTGVHKWFGGVHALRGAELRIENPGTIHGLIGANGSGKSTLLSILSGQQKPDEGLVELNGQPLPAGRSALAVRRGVAMVSQETALAPNLSIAENVLLGGRQSRHRLRGIDWTATHTQASVILARLGLSLDPTTPAGLLRPDQQQLIEIARALSLDARLLILDEPTSSLTDDEVDGLFGVVHSLASDGVSVILVSHRLGELIEHCDELTVLRQGETVASGPISNFNAHSIVTAMVGEQIAAAAESTTSLTAVQAANSLLRVRDLSTAGAVHDVNLDVRRGEILGLAGIVGAGRSELLEALFGTEPITSGSVSLNGKPYAPRTPRDAIAAGVGYLPADRKVQGLVLQRSIAENLSMVTTHTRGRWRAPGGAEVGRFVVQTARDMRVNAPALTVPVNTLSGGNQQKVALGKWVAAQSQLLLLDQPTRGVDVAAKTEIHRTLRALAAKGAGVIVSSPEPEELLALCDRFVVLFRGQVVATIDRAQASVARLAALSAGHEESAA